MGFTFELPDYSLKPALLVSFLSVWVLVAVFAYLNLYTKRRYFSIWTAAWLFYALWLTLRLVRGASNQLWMLMLEHWCVGLSAAFLLWGAIRFLKLETRQRLFGLFMAFLAVWSYVGLFHLQESYWVQQPIFGLIGLASVLTSWGFWRMRKVDRFVGAGLLSLGFALWGLYLACYPLLQVHESIASTGFFLSAVLQLFIAVSMIVLVLEEVRVSSEKTKREIETQKVETTVLRNRIVSTEERYRSLFDQASEAIVICRGLDLSILELNQTAKRLLGMNGGDPSQHNLTAYCMFRAGQKTNPKDGPEWFNVICKERQFQLIRKDGGVTPVEVDGAPISFEGEPAYQFFFRELTERTRLEQQLRQAEKLSALGQMISGVAHELNNPLAVIKGYLELILSRHELTRQTRTDLEKVAHESNRAAKLVSNFLSFAREQPVHRQRIKINEVINRVVELRKFDLKVTGTNVVLELDPALPDTAADPDQLQQVLVNLVNNALHAMAEKTASPRLTIRTLRKGAVIEIQVEDNGPGVPPSVLPHIFEPFFTTKEVGSGTGLGLSIAHSILADHQGKIYYRNASNGGAIFCLELPVSGSDQSSLTDSELEKTPPLGEQTDRTARILILDDERSLAELLGEMLTILGYSTQLCGSAQQALDLLEKRRFDLILSDYRMPVMDGQQFYLRVKQRDPEMARRIIFLTGDVVNEETQAFLMSTGNPHLSKPFQLSSVERIVAEGLAK